MNAESSAPFPSIPVAALLSLGAPTARVSPTIFTDSPNLSPAPVLEALR